MKSRTQTLALKFSAITTLAILVLFAAAAAIAEESSDTRTSATIGGQGIERGALGAGSITYDERPALQTSGSRSKTRKSSEQTKTGASVAAANVDFWIYDVDLQLFSDFDRDGFYYGIDLLFDADTNYISAEVYAVIYLSYEGGPWNEYAETENFNIYGASSDDEYVVVSELVSGYPTGDYDILIELFDTFDNSFVASIGPEDTSSLSFVPLEDIGRDSPNETTIVVSSGGGGALGLWSLLGLALLILTLRLRGQTRP